ncbi:hypothetical protein KCU78_g24250, partial [Aureobasidium melanogenum]
MTKIRGADPAEEAPRPTGARSYWHPSIRHLVAINPYSAHSSILTVAVALTVALTSPDSQLAQSGQHRSLSAASWQWHRQPPWAIGLVKPSELVAVVNISSAHFSFFFYIAPALVALTTPSWTAQATVQAISSQSTLQDIYHLAHHRSRPRCP